MDYIGFLLMAVRRALARGRKGGAYAAPTQLPWKPSGMRWPRWIGAIGPAAMSVALTTARSLHLVPAPDHGEQPAVAFIGIDATRNEHRLGQAVAAGQKISPLARAVSVDMRDP
jgi:hypothetical protein